MMKIYEIISVWQSLYLFEMTAITATKAIQLFKLVILLTIQQMNALRVACAENDSRTLAHVVDEYSRNRPLADQVFRLLSDQFADPYEALKGLLESDPFISGFTVREILRNGIFAGPPIDMIM